MAQTPAPSTQPIISAIVPARNERGAVASLVDELESALGQIGPFEVIYVDDGSSDGMGDEIARLMATRPWLRQFRHERSGGQSASVRTGVRAARAPIIATLDGDGENNPAYIPELYKALTAAPDNGIAAGQRCAAAFSRMARGTRAAG
jgi:dolichol-phosphate mannosyltransferase